MIAHTLQRVKHKLRSLTGAGASQQFDESGVNSISASDQRIISQVRPYTMTSPLRIEALLKAVRYTVERELSGAFVECGVWRGGSVLAMLLQLKSLGVVDRDIYLYDTFEGMTTPTDKDTTAFGESALQTWQRSNNEGTKAWDGFFNPEIFNETAVRELLCSTGYPTDRLHFVRGPVEKTIPDTVPEGIAILRLDTDWYESTLHELQHLYPLICQGGTLIIDDYGHWEGCRQAVQEYFERPDVTPLLLNRIDYTGRIAVKV